MWEDSSTDWTHFRQDVMAARHAEARLLVQFLACMERQSLHTSSLEIIDLQRYRVISRSAKVRAALRERVHIPFVFVVGRN